MTSSKYYIVTLENTDTLDLQKLIEYSQSKFKSDGYEEFSLNEEQVDEILGEDAFCGGDLTEELMKRLEEKASRKLKFYFSSKEAKLHSSAFLKYLIDNNLSATLEEQEEEDWNESWKQHYEPILLDSFVVLPVWEKDSDIGGKREKIIINPGMGFGTGTHETTRQCMLSLLELKNKKENLKNCLDFGSGSGILGISYHKIFEGPVDFVDIDKRAIENNKNNSVLNFPSIDEGFNYYVREEYSEKKQYDLVFANILEPVLLAEYQTISEAVGDQKYLIISGILNEQKESIVKKYDSKFEILFEKSEGDWMAITFKKK